MVEPLAASLTDEEAEDPDFVDPEIEQVHEDAAAAEERGLAELRADRA